MVIQFDTSLLTSYYQARSGVGAASLASSSGAGRGTKKAPTPPWSPTSKAPPMSELLRSVMRGGRFIDPQAAKLDVSSGAAAVNQDYRNMFGLYQGLMALEGLAEQMQGAGLSSSQKTQIQQRFAAGMKEVQAFMGADPFSTVNLVGGATAANAQSTAGVEKGSDVFTTGVVHTGSSSTAVAAFQGDVRFSLAVEKQPSGVVVNVDFDLAEMGATPRTMADTITYMNGKLEAAGLSTRFGTVYTPGAPQKVKVGNTTVTLGTSPDTYALKIKGSVVETLTFSSPTAAPAVYLAETSGLTSAKTAAPTQQMMKFATDGSGAATTAADGKVFDKTLNEAIKTVRASVTGSDGSLYVLADVQAAIDGQSIKGEQDVALMKYDSSGNLLFTRTLGAADSASGYALSLSADGTKLAVAGSVSGTFDTNDALGAAKNGTDSFVSLFDSDGQELWTQRRGGTADDRVDAVTIGADNTVYIAGRASSAMPGAVSQGQQDAYVAAFASASATSLDGVTTWTGTPKFTVQYGTSGIDAAVGIALSGSSLVVASTEGSDAVVRRYDLQPTGAPVLGLTRNLGSLQGGELTGVGIATDGSVIVTGSTHNAALAAGTITNAHDGGRDVFVAKLSADLAAAGTDRLTYFGGATTRTASAAVVSGDKVYVTGQVTITPPPGQTTAHDGYVAAIDPTTGAISWTKQFAGTDSEAAPTAIAVDQGGASSLDRLGFPKGTLDFTGSSALVIGGVPSAKDQLIAATSLRAGDRFYVGAGGGAQKSVTIEAQDTLKTLATKISRALGFNAKVEVVGANGYDRLKITPASQRTEIEIRAGDADRNALEGLGFAEGILKASTGANQKKTYALKLESNLNLDDSKEVGHARAVLSEAVAVLRTAFREITAPPAPAKSASGPVPAYITNQIANYSQALARLTGGG